MKITKILTIEKAGDWVVANTPDLDRDKDRIFPDKINVTNFKKNPALFWGHNYRDPWALIGEVAEWQVDEKSFRFKPELRETTGESDPMNIIHSLWDNGLLRAASIGFIPDSNDLKKNDEGGYDFGEIELLEISLVPLPAHQDALRMAIKGFVEVDPDDKSAIPPRDEGKAPEEESWSRPTLGDFTDKDPGDLTTADYRRIMRHFAWTANSPPQAYGDLKFPHHRPVKSGVGPAVWRGVANAAARLNQSNVPDKEGIKRHLAFHYRQFDKPIPWEEGREYSDEEWLALFPEFDVIYEKDESNITVTYTNWDGIQVTRTYNEGEFITLDIDDDPDPQPDDDEPNNDTPPHDESESMTDAELDELQQEIDQLLEVLQ